MRLKLKIIPGASRTEIVEWLDDTLKIAVSAQPQSGKANKAVIKLLACALETTHSNLELCSGLNSPRKVIKISHLNETEIIKKINAMCK